MRVKIKLQKQKIVIIKELEKAMKDDLEKNFKTIKKINFPRGKLEIK